MLFIHFLSLKTNIFCIRLIFIKNFSLSKIQLLNQDLILLMRAPYTRLFDHYYERYFMVNGKLKEPHLKIRAKYWT